ncbi:Tripeptidyl peptidase ii [Hibiscus syriacus]|uniref:Tripeptidyl peptidase ii n=1 Tax=Hibiscus syriacus TaxID=106335 RepID=A0A6A3C4V0_HIBSY|nr:Tripeptidyl peptidase ii [Hibiscus syriacus]
MSSTVLGENWGKPLVFKRDRKPIFGSGLVMVEGFDWVRHRHAMASSMVEPTTLMLNKWTTLISSGQSEIDVEREITTTAGEIIPRTSFGLSNQEGREVYEKLRAMQITLFNSNRYVGVPFSKWLFLKKTLEARKLGKEIDQLLLSIIVARNKSWDGSTQKDLLGLLMEGNHLDGGAGKSLMTREFICHTLKLV